MNPSDPTEARQDARRLAAIALAEDGARDITSEVAVDASLAATGRVEARSELVLAGVPYADAVADLAGCRMEWAAREGEVLGGGDTAGILSGPMVSVLRAERSLLNLLQRGSGIATETRRYVAAVAGTRCRILHTRKTAPGLRLFDVRSVLAGGGGLHRTDLAAIVMIKDNHWQALRQQGRTLAEAVSRARAEGAQAVQVEVESERQLIEACEAGADRLMVDNQDPAVLARWAERARALRPGIEVEATGGITLDNVVQYARAGADFISIGALTHSARAADLALEIR